MASGPWSTEAGGKGHACYLDCLRSPPAVAPVDTWSWGPVLQCQETQCRITARHCQRRGETWKNTVQTGVSREVPGLPSQKIRFQTQTTTLSLQIRAAECWKANCGCFIMITRPAYRASKHFLAEKEFALLEQVSLLTLAGSVWFLNFFPPPQNSKR